MDRLPQVLPFEFSHAGWRDAMPARDEWASERGVVYRDAAARGRLRLLKRGLSNNWDLYLRRVAAPNAAIREHVTAFDKKSSIIGRKRAFAKVNSLLTSLGSVLEVVDYRSRIALWSILRPRTHLIFNPSTPADAQMCISVNFIAFTPGSQSHGQFTLEIPDHALGRLYERDPQCDAKQVILEAHHTLLGLDSEALTGRVHDFYCPPGRAHFAVRCAAASARPTTTTI